MNTLTIDAQGGREILDDGEVEWDDERKGVAPGACPEAFARRQQLIRRLGGELERLPEAHRAAFELVHGDGLTMAEAAEVLGITSNAVKIRTHRACKALRTSLGEELRQEFEGAT